MDEKQPLSYFVSDEADKEEAERHRDRIALKGVLAIAFGLLLAVVVVPELANGIRRAPPGVANVPPPASAVPPVPPRPRSPGTGELRVVFAIEAYREANGAYPTGLDQLGKGEVGVSFAEAAKWHYAASQDGT
jgi:hypothetical protein